METIRWGRVPPEGGSRVAARDISWFDRALEGCWLAVAAFLPVFVVPESLAVGFVQMPKVFLLRSATLLAITLIVIEWAALRRDGRSLTDEVGIARLWLGDIWTHLRQSPIVASAIAVLLVTVVSADLSPMRVVSIEGARPGWDTYGLYNVASYVVMFGLVATRLRTRAQLERLIWAVTSASMLIGLYGIGRTLNRNATQNRGDVSGSMARTSGRASGRSPVANASGSRSVVAIAHGKGKGGHMAALVLRWSVARGRGAARD